MIKDFLELPKILTKNKRLKNLFISNIVIMYLQALS